MYKTTPNAITTTTTTKTMTSVAGKGSFCGGWVLIAVQWAGVAPWVAMLVAAFATTLLRAVALVTGWTVPEWSHGAKRRD